MVNASDDLYNHKCQEYWHAGMSAIFVAVCLPQLITCFVSLILVITFSCIFFRKGNYHPNAKIIVAVQLIFVVIFCSEYFYGLAKHFYNYFYHSNDPCSFVEWTGDCAIFYYSHFTSLAGMGLTQMFLSAERFISSRFAKNYETFGRTIGVLCAALAIGLSVLIAWFSLHSFDPTEMRLTCLGSPYSGKSVFLYITLISCDMVSMTMFFLTWYCARKKKEPAGQYVLGRVYQRREIRNVIKMFAPVNIAHFFVYCFYAMSTAILRMYVYSMDPDFVPVIAIVVMLVPYYTTFELIILHIMLKKVEKAREKFTRKVVYQKKEDEKEQYFDVLAKQWQ